MRIAHVVTYISADGAFGGPVAVAMAQAEELARRGHTVELLAGWDGVATVDVPGVTVRLFPVRRLPVGGFSGLFSASLVREFLSANPYDIVHVHLARDLITLPVALLVQRRRLPFVVQPHGMVRPDRRLKARIFDALATRAVLRAARVSLALTDAEVADLIAMTGGGPGPSASPTASLRLHVRASTGRPMFPKCCSSRGCIRESA
ncbi:glycosyltransferase [Leifsonia sp. L25]|uniref:glycosyltransferase n=1 Tax=Actinomycetes TaxID=1760 RepID=UPI003D69101B